MLELMLKLLLLLELFFFSYTLACCAFRPVRWIMYAVGDVCEVMAVMFMTMVVVRLREVGCLFVDTGGVLCFQSAAMVVTDR